MKVNKMKHAKKYIKEGNFTIDMKELRKALKKAGNERWEVEVAVDQLTLVEEEI